MIIEKNTKNGIAINHPMKTATKGKQAAAAQNSSCITLLQLTTRPKHATATSIHVIKHRLLYLLKHSLHHKL